MTTIDTNTATTFTADREDIAYNLSMSEILGDFLATAGDDRVSDETRQWAQEYVEAITEALPGHGEQDAVDAVIAELKSMKEDHYQDAANEIEDAVADYGFDVQALHFTTATAQVVIFSSDDEELSEDEHDDLSDAITTILDNHYAGHLLFRLVTA